MTVIGAAARASRATEYVRPKSPPAELEGTTLRAVRGIARPYYNIS